MPGWLLVRVARLGREDLPVKKYGTTVVLGLLATIAGASPACSERHAEIDACYFDDSEDAEKYSPVMAWQDWCENTGASEVSPLIDEHCPAGNCVDIFITCDEVPRDQECQTCPAAELDNKVLVALGSRYEERCPASSHDLIDFERGCMYERELIPASENTRNCCYTAVVVGECSLMGT